MTPLKLLLTFVAILAPARLFADGGETVQLRTEAGGLLITVFSSPSPLFCRPRRCQSAIAEAEWAGTRTRCECFNAAPDRRVGQ